MDLDYLIQAVKIVVSGQLKENHDDTLIEKLITLVERNVEEDVFTRKDEIKILTVLIEFLEMDQPEPTCFRLIATILSDLYISYGHNSDEDILDSAFVAFVAASRVVTSSSELSLQSSFVRSYAYISDKNSNILESNHIRSNDLSFLPEKITELMRNSSSYYVRSEAEKLLIDLFLNNQGNIENDSRNKLRIELSKIVDTPSETNLSFLKLLASKTSMTRSLIRMEVRDKMFDHFKSIVSKAGEEDQEPHLTLCLEVLGSLVPKQTVVEYVIGSLVKLNRLKALIVFTSTLMKSDRDHLNKWMQYSLYTLVCKSESRYEVTSQILISVRERNFIEKLCNNQIILSILTRIPSVLPNIDERESLLRETLQILLTDELRKNANRKIVSAAISCLGKMLEEGVSPAKEVIKSICELIPLTSGHHKIELLTICRNFYGKTLKREVVGIDRICDTLDNIFKSYINNDTKCDRDELYGDQAQDSEILEAAVQVFGVISCSPSISSKLDVIKSYQILFRQRSEHLPFITASVPVLFSVNFELSQEQLKDIFGWEKNVDIIQILCSYLRAEDSSLLQMKVIETLKDESNFERVSFLQTFRTDLFFKDLVPSLCHCLLSSVDTETQRNVINLMTTIFEFPKEGLIQLLYTSSVLDLLFFIIQNKDGTFPRTLRVEVSELVIILKHFIKEMLDNGSSLNQLLEKCDAPQESVKSRMSSQENDISPIPVEEKVQGIELLFNSSVNQPTMDLIAELNRRQMNGDSCESTEKRMKVTRTIHDLKELVSFYTDPNNRVILDEDPDEDSLIIDDIVSAQIRPNVASSDCY